MPHMKTILIRCAVLILFAVFILFTATTSEAEANEDSNVKTFHLYATDGYFTMPDGEEMYIWGYSLKNEKGTAAYPAPTLTAEEGDLVRVTLTNIGSQKEGQKKLAHTIHWHGLDTDQFNDGVPHTSLGLNVGDSFTYQFKADQAGTYFYHCHVDTIEHLQMGMHGSFIVKAKNGAKQAWTNGPEYDKEYVFHINEIDPVWHKAVEEGRPYDRTDLNPKYWTINGKAFPDTEEDPSAYIEGVVGDRVLIRFINAGYNPRSFHMHGFHFDVIATDGRPLENIVEKDTILIGPGERYDILVTFDQDGAYPLHSHNIVDNTNNGVYPGGLHTMIYVHPKPNRVMILNADQSEVKINEAAVHLNAAPFIESGTTYVPLRFVGEQFNADVRWIDDEKSVIYSKPGMEIQLWVGKNNVLINGSPFSLSTPPRLDNGSTMVPLRFVSEQLGAKVDYDVQTKQITISYLSDDAKLALLPGGHGGHEGHATGPQENRDNEAVSDQIIVEINNSVYSPAHLEIKKGQTVTWINRDTQPHDVIDINDAFTSPALYKDQSFSFTFNDAGMFDYYCSFHPIMQGKITVIDE